MARICPKNGKRTMKQENSPDDSPSDNALPGSTVGFEPDGPSSKGRSYLEYPVSPDALRALFDAAAALYCARPWHEVPNEYAGFGLTCEAIGLDAVAVVLDDRGGHPGMLLFEDDAGHRAWLACTGIRYDSAPRSVPAHRSLRFVSRSRLPKRMVDEVARHGWSLAGDDAYPMITTFDADMRLRHAETEDFAAFEVAARALVEILPAEHALEQTWATGVPWTRAFAVATDAGELPLTVEVPPVSARLDVDADTDLHAALAALDEDPLGIDPRRLVLLIVELVRRLTEWARGDAGEGSGFGEGRRVALLADQAANNPGHTLAALDADGLRDVLFVHVPRTFVGDPSAARGIVDELRALYRYLDVEWGLAQAPACLDVLGGGAVERLERELADVDNWSMVKRPAMRALAAGYDLTTPQGMDEFERNGDFAALGGPSLLGEYGVGERRVAAPTLDPEVKRKRDKRRKDQRKAARKARKKSR